MTRKKSPAPSPQFPSRRPTSPRMHGARGPALALTSVGPHLSPEAC